MCLSKLTQIIYGVLAVCIIAFILGSMFTPGWRKIRAEVQNGTDSGAIFNETITKGIFPFGCAISTDASGVHFNRTHAIEQCEQWWNNQPGYEKAVIALMVVALATSLLALAWNILTFFCCLGKGGIFRPLPSLAATTTICLLVAIIVFYANNKTDIEMVRKWKDVKKVDDFNDVSYSFYLAIAATVFAVVNVIVGSITVQAADKCL